jgi:hypothetical protein
MGGAPVRRDPDERDVSKAFGDARDDRGLPLGRRTSGRVAGIDALEPHDRGAPLLGLTGNLYRLLIVIVKPFRAATLFERSGSPHAFAVPLIRGNSFALHVAPTPTTRAGNRPT